MRLLSENNREGVLLKPRIRKTGEAWGSVADAARSGVLWANRAARDAVSPGGCTMAFIFVYLYTLVLYVRPGEIFPGVFGGIPLAQITAAATPILFIFGKLSRKDKLIVWPVELKMSFVIALLGIVLTPIAVSPQDSITLLTDIYLKLIIVFTLLINLTDTRQRLRSLVYILFFSGCWLSIDTILSYLAGDFYDNSGGIGRIEGTVGGLFSNPNDRATLFGMMFPLAIAFGLQRRGMAKIMYLAMGTLFILGVLASYSRGGFLGLAVGGGVMIWKFRRSNRGLPWLAAGALMVFLVVAVPGGYGDRLMTIFNPSADKTESAQARQRVLGRAVMLAVRHSIIGLGIENFHIYSYHELKAHNSYLEIAAELGFVGLLAYLIMIIRPVRTLSRIERRNRDMETESGRENFYFSVGLQSTFYAYFVCSFFTSIQYLWYIYYPIVFAIALHRINEFERPDEKEALGAEETTRDAGRGVLWRPKREGALLSK